MKIKNKALKSGLFALGLFCGMTGTALGQQTVGLFTYEPGASDAYLLVAPNGSTNTYLVDNCGRQVHQWTSQYNPGNAVYVTPDGNLLRTCRIQNPNFPAGGSGGRVEILDWNSNVLWSYTVSDNSQQQHHDAVLMPNGNVMLLVWRRYAAADAIAAGRNPAGVGNYLWSEVLMEVQPSGQSGGTVVWEWDLMDHLIQDFDSTKANFGVVADHPELMNLNYYDPNPGTVGFADWLHSNAIAYNADLDQVVVSNKFVNEFFIVDHSTTTAEAAGHTGGNQGKGGDFLYRWGNPAAYGRGTVSDQILYGQHNVHWIPDGSPDAGKLILFNNGDGRPAGEFSTVEIIEPPVDSAGAYTLVGNQPFGPSASFFVWSATPPTSFYSKLISGAEQQPNGNIVACAGQSGRVVEVTPAGDVVWEYVNPVQGTGPLTQGTTPTNNGMFRGPRYPSTYSGFSGQTLTPGNPLELNPLPLPAICTTSSISGERLITISVYPNPGNDRFTVVHDAGEPIEMVVLDALGRKVVCQVASRGETIVDCAAWPAGLYMITGSDFAPIRWVKH